MPTYVSEQYRDRCPLAGQQGCAERWLPNWSFMQGAFGTSRNGTDIMPTDVDGLIERNGKFLVIENKATESPMSVGQNIAYRHLVALPDNMFTVLVLVEYISEACGGCTVRKMGLMADDGSVELRDTTTDAIREYLAAWFTWASAS